jgi:hypothetical protein
MQTVYSRYSRSRKPEYQIVTLIESDGENKVVWKKALTLAARSHIERIISNYETLCNIYGKDHVAKAELADEDTVRFDYIEGGAWGAKIANIGYTKGKQEFFSELRRYYHFLEAGKSTQENSDLDFSVQASGGKMINIDLHPDNILYTEQGPVIIDYEWLYADAPISFVFQRSMFNFYYNFYHSSLENVTMLEEIWEHFDVTEADRRCYARLEKAFLDAVGADSFMNRYQKKNIYLDDVLSLKKQVKNRLLKYMHLIKA